MTSLLFKAISWWCHYGRYSGWPIRRFSLTCTQWNCTCIRILTHTRCYYMLIIITHCLFFLFGVKLVLDINISTTSVSTNLFLLENSWFYCLFTEQRFIHRHCVCSVKPLCFCLTFVPEFIDGTLLLSFLRASSPHTHTHLLLTALYVCVFVLYI